MPEFRFALPAITELYDDQILAYSPRQSMLVTGGPGSGKTVVTIFRFLRAVRDRKEIVLFTFNKTLIYSIKGALRQRSEELFAGFSEEEVANMFYSNFKTFFQWHQENMGWFDPFCDENIIEGNFNRFLSLARKNVKFDEFFFDEGQDIPPNVFAKIFGLASVISVGADRAQNYKRYYPQDEVEDIINHRLNLQSKTQWQILAGNFRNTRQIFELARRFVPNDERVQAMNSADLKNGNRPEIQLGLTENEQLDLILRVIRNNKNSNIGILVHVGPEVDRVKIYLEGQGYSCQQDAPDEFSFSYYKYNMKAADEEVMMKKLKSPFIATFESCKGLEFDVVIMPFFEKSDWATRTLNSSGRAYATENHYYVAVTRAKNDIFILCNKRPNSLNFYDENEEELLDNLLF